jgi:DNA-3-methyladenine glycosylase II
MPADTRHEVRLRARGPFSLAASARFLEGFAPAGYEGAGDGRLRLAFPVEGQWRTAGVSVAQRDREVVARVVGDADAEAVRAQLARILSLDVDGSGFPAVGERDPVIGDLQRRYPGLRPVTFLSAYEAAAWAVLSRRVRSVQAAAVQQRIAERWGLTLDVDGVPVAAFPAPDRLRTIERVRGLTDRKVAELRGIADAALGGRLDSAPLRGLPRERALGELRELPGIGPFSAELVLLRGAGDPDHLPANERRLHRAMARRYGLRDPAPAALAAVADAWRPYRTWAALLLRVWLEEETREIAGPRNGA